MDINKIKGSLCVFGTTIAYGLVPSLSFLAFETGVATETLLFNKFFYASILMWAVILIKKVNFRLDKKAIKVMVLICGSYIGLATTLYIAFNYISGSLATIVSFTFPAIIVAVEMIRGIEKVRFLKILAVVFSMIGMIFVVWTPDMASNIIGILFAFGTAICYVFYIFGLSSKSLKDVNSLVVAGYVLLSSAIFNLIRCYLSGESLFTFQENQLAYMLVLAVVCAFLAILLNAKGVKLIGPSNAAIVNTFEPLFACIFGYILVGDRLTVNMIIGSGFIITAVLIANLPKRKKLSSNL